MKKYGKIPTPPQNRPKPGFWVIYGRMAGSDAWNMFLWTFQDFDFWKMMHDPQNRAWHSLPSPVDAPALCNTSALVGQSKNE